MSPELKRIDVHHHIVPPEYVRALADVGITESAGIPFPGWSAEAALDVMDRQGIKTAITSISYPGVYFGDLAFARDLARLCNEMSARLVGDHPRRFGAFAVLPLPDVEAALIELEYALDTLRLDGVTLLSSIGNEYLGSPSFEALYSELNRRRAVVFVHPAVPPGSDVPKLILPPALIEFTWDTTRAATNLLFSGTLERYPDIRFILSHAGGTVPYLAWRISLGEWLPALGERVPQGVMTYIKRLYYDTALSTNKYTLRSLQELIDVSHILFGSDYPFLPELAVAATVSDLQSYDGFSAQDRGLVECGNALCLFPRLEQ
ncbi:MAG: amidohydrolase family protein [Dehalococcoidia bacterium]|nr:amidohydrolase family protein [Dehalococcoidia bacterium]